jgi:2-dehydro-3-deoxyphosphogluconate aldolase/(4S)-4-hydroxy-2-oxoglutarate aldolase
MPGDNAPTPGPDAATDRTSGPLTKGGQTMNGALTAIRECRIVAVLRALEPSHLAVVADVLVACGIRAVEFSLSTPGALDAIRTYRPVAAAGTFLGAGTVVTGSEANQAIDAGARYLVTPAFIPEVIDIGAARSVPVIAGALTPTEVLAAYSAGASAVKIFPAALGGPSYLRLLREPLPNVPMVPPGGVRLEDAANYIAAGAIAVGIGSQLTGDALSGGDLGALAERATRLVQMVTHQ